MKETSGSYLVSSPFTMRAGCLVTILTVFKDRNSQLQQHHHLNTFSASSATFAVRARSQILVHRICRAFSAVVRVNSCFSKIQSLLKENHQDVKSTAFTVIPFSFISLFLSFTFDFRASYLTLSLKSIFDVQISFVPKTFLRLPLGNSAR